MTAPAWTVDDAWPDHVLPLGAGLAMRVFRDGERWVWQLWDDVNSEMPLCRKTYRTPELARAAAEAVAVGMLEALASALGRRVVALEGDATNTTE